MIVFMYIRQREPAKIVSKEWKLTIVFLRGLNVVSPDGNGRTGRLILFRECLKHNIISFVIEDANRYEYLEALKAYREKGDCQKLVTLFQKEQDFYYKQCRYFFEQGKE